MANFRDFDAEAVKREKPVFRLAGETFTCKAKLSWNKMSSLLRGLQNLENDVSVLLRVDEFFAVVLIKEDRDRFFQALENSDESDDGENAVDVEQVKELMTWLMEHYAGNASGQSTASSPGLPSTVTSLRAGSSLPVTETA